MSENKRGQAGPQLATVLEAITTAEPQPSPTGVEIGGLDGFNALSGGVVRPQHALAAAQAPDDSVVFAWQDVQMFVAAKATTVKNDQFVLLVLGRAERGKWIITAGYRLYGSTDEVAALASEARSAFQTFLERYALPYRSEEGWVLFRPIHIVKPKPGQAPESSVEFDKEGQQRGAINSFMRVDPDGTMTYAFLFAVGFDTYQRDIAKHRR